MNEEFEEYLNQTTEKELLFQILMELQGIRMHFEGGTESETEMYRCIRCNEKVPFEDRQSHAETEHKAPPGVNLSELYEPL